MFGEIYNGGLMFKRSFYFLSILSFFLVFSSYARAGVDAEVAYILNTFSFLVCGFLVMWMAAGFLFLESGLVTTRSVSTIAAKILVSLQLFQLYFIYLVTTWDTEFLKVDILELFQFGLTILL